MLFEVTFKKVFVGGLLDSAEIEQKVSAATKEYIEFLFKTRRDCLVNDLTRNGFYAKDIVVTKTKAVA